MKIRSIEPTPSPHSMKINVTETLPDGVAFNYKRGDASINDAPDYIKQLFAIDGIINIYRVIDFITIARNPRTPWETILPQVQDVLGIAADTDIEDFNIKETQTEPAFGEIRVFVQMFRNIPMQVKIDDGTGEKRFGLPEKFTNAVLKASSASPNIILERKWVEQQVRYGKPDDVGQEVVEELDATYSEDRLAQLVELAFNAEDGTKIEDIEKTQRITLETLDHPDWRVRYAALDQMGEPTLQDLPILDKALDDERSSIRRLATAYLGMIEEPEVLPYLYKALKDPSASVRRTAGDCLSDLGFKEAIPEMIKALKDESQIVRWRAAMFLYEVGDESAIPALQEAENDPEFEVRMQVKMALERIERGDEAKGSIWHQMIQATKK